MNPKGVLFGEPMSAFDAEIAKEVLDTTTALAAEGATMIVVMPEINSTGAASSAGLADGDGVEGCASEALPPAAKQRRLRKFLSQRPHGGSPMSGPEV
jgi:ABC-type histidine transport system ATPase subunit